MATTESRKNGNGGFTVAAVSLAAMSVVAFDHEALGHGGVCLASGGHIRLLTSSMFECDPSSVWIAPAGPICNLLCGLLALLLVRAVPQRYASWRLLLKRLAQEVAAINQHAEKLNCEMSDALSFQAGMD